MGAKEFDREVVVKVVIKRAKSHTLMETEAMLRLKLVSLGYVKSVDTVTSTHVRGDESQETDEATLRSALLDPISGTAHLTGMRAGVGAEKLVGALYSLVTNHPDVVSTIARIVARKG